MKAISSRAVVVGVGLIGGSLALAGKRAGVLERVTGVGRSHANLDDALRAGAIDAAETDLDRALTGADLVVLAAPADTCVGLLARVSSQAGTTAVLTDVASVKAPIVDAAARLGVAARFVGCHPMAGGTATGAAAGDADLFKGRTVVVTPAGADARARDTVVALWRAVGADVCELEAAEHDRAVAMSSHLPQFLASALCAVVGTDPREALIRRLSGAGFRDTTRIAAGDSTMWGAVARENRENLIDALDRFAQILEQLRSALARGDDAAVRKLLEEGAAMRRRLT